MSDLHVNGMDENYMNRVLSRDGNAPETETTKASNPKDAAASTRLDLSLFPAPAIVFGAIAMSEGDLKYGGYNYRVAGVNASVYYSACNRHLMKWYNGEENDPKTGVPHLASALACIGVLIDAMCADKLNDDRPPRVDMTHVLDVAQKKIKHLQELFPNRVPRYTHRQQPPRGMPAYVGADPAKDIDFEGVPPGGVVKLPDDCDPADYWARQQYAEES